MSWTDERVEALKKMWAEGKSASEIATELGEVTRNAVIGKVHRLGLKSRTAKESKPSESAAKKAKPAKKEAAAPAAEPKPKVKAEEPVVEAKAEEATEAADAGDAPVFEVANNDEISQEARMQAARIEEQSKRLNLMQLTERTCKWPVGDPATEDFWFCGHPSQPGKPYCEAHVELAFQAPMSRRDRR